MGLIRGELPAWAASRSGYGSGDGYGHGYGDGSGYGDGDGDGEGSGEGSGSQVVACSPAPVTVTVADLERVSACGGGVSAFAAAFPSGAQWPADRDKALVAGLDVAWAEKKLGLLVPA